jgi:hypothetical protein
MQIIYDIVSHRVCVLGILCLHYLNRICTSCKVPFLFYRVYHFSYFGTAVEKKYPGDRDRLGRMSLIEEGFPKQVRMAFLACIGSRKVNGVAEVCLSLDGTKPLWCADGSSVTQ